MKQDLKTLRLIMDVSFYLVWKKCCTCRRRQDFLYS